MKILHRYISREFLKTFLFGIIALILVSTVVYLFERIDDIVKTKPPMSVIVTFFLARIPQVLFLITPISMLLTTLLVIGAFARKSEIIAMLATGVSIYQILAPLLIIGAVVSLLMLGMNEFIVPTANRITEENKRIMRGRPDMRNMAKIQIWFRGDQENRIYYIDTLIPERREIRNLTVFELNDRFVPVKRLDAEIAKYKESPTAESGTPQTSLWTTFSRFVSSLWANLFEKQDEDQPENPTKPLGAWTLYQGTERELGSLENMPVVTFRERQDYLIPRSFQEFRQETKDPQDMNYRELAEYIRRLSASGYDVSEYIVDLKAKWSYPFVSFVMVIIGFPFALKSPRSGAAMGVGLSVFIGLTYWIVLQLGIALGHAHIFPPIIAAWISHIFFAATGLYLILSART